MNEIFMLVVEIIFIAVLIIGSAFLAYMSNHMVSEKKAGRSLPLPWEKRNNE